MRSRWPPRPLRRPRRRTPVGSRRCSGRSRPPRRRACAAPRRYPPDRPARRARRLDLDGFRHASQEHEAAEREPDHDALGEVAKDRQEEGGEKDDGISARRPEAWRTRASRPCSRPPPRARRRGPRAGCSSPEGAATSMNRSRKTECSITHRAVGAGAHVGRGSRDRAGDADASEERGGEVRGPWATSSQFER